MAEKQLKFSVTTSSENTLVISEGEGGLVLTAGSAKIEVKNSGITIDNGNGAKLVLTGATVSVNDGVLKVT